MNVEQISGSGSSQGRAWQKPARKRWRFTITPFLAVAPSALKGDGMPQARAVPKVKRQPEDAGLRVASI